MSKLPLTIEMADTIRELRLQNKITSKDITLALGRSPSYISKIESGYIKSISEEEFDIILSMILPGCTSAQERLDKLIEYQVKRYGRLGLVSEPGYGISANTYTHRAGFRNKQHAQGRCNYS